MLLRYYYYWGVKLQWLKKSFVYEYHVFSFIKLGRASSLLDHFWAVVQHVARSTFRRRYNYYAFCTSWSQWLSCCGTQNGCNCTIWLTNCQSNQATSLRTKWLAWSIHVLYNFVLHSTRGSTSRAPILLSVCPTVWPSNRTQLWVLGFICGGVQPRKISRLSIRRYISNELP